MIEQQPWTHTDQNQMTDTVVSGTKLADEFGNIWTVIDDCGQDIRITYDVRNDRILAVTDFDYALTVSNGNFTVKIFPSDIVSCFLY